MHTLSNNRRAAAAASRACTGTPTVPMAVRSRGSSSAHKVASLARRTTSVRASESSQGGSNARTVTTEPEAKPSSGNGAEEAERSAVLQEDHEFQSDRAPPPAPLPQEGVSGNSAPSATASDQKHDTTNSLSGDLQDAASEAAAEGDSSTGAMTEAYSEVMNRRMGTSLTYRHDLGIDYNRILDDLIVGSCLQTAEDVDRLADKEGVTTIFSLQEDSDMDYFSLDLKPITQRCEERGDIKHVRFPIRDFDPYDLRRKLPRAVSRLAREHKQNEGVVYIHCTAGMGRAPATALAYMYWIRGMQLDEAHKKLTTLRKCGPKIEAIRSATCDLLLGTEPVDATIALSRFGTAEKIQVAGLDAGWHAPLDMTRDLKQQRFVLHRKLYPGKYQYKFIVDGVWSYSADHPTAQDGFSVNNTLEVIPSHMSPETIQTQMRLLSVGSALTSEEQEELRALLDPWHKGKDGNVPGSHAEIPALRSLDPN